MNKKVKKKSIYLKITIQRENILFYLAKFLVLKL